MPLKKDWTILFKHVQSFENHLDGMSNVFDEVKEKVVEMREKSQALEIELNEMKAKFNEIYFMDLHFRSKIWSASSSFFSVSFSISGFLKDVQCADFSSNLIFDAIHEESRENTENVLRDFLAEHLEIDYRFGERNKKRARPIVAKFIYQDDLDHVLLCAKKTPER